MARLLDRVIGSLSFSGELHRLRRELNARVDDPRRDREDAWSQPLGVTRWFRSRRVSIAEAYVRVVRDLDSHRARSRLAALKRLMELSFHSSTLDMPLNTARIQLALVKEAVKNRGNRRRQLELLQDFSDSSTGQHPVIRRLLRENHMIELPELGKPLRELDAGFDGNVHDSSTSGRKNATQLLIDAFIKGISELTLACGGPTALEQMAEAVEAGRVVGIRVRLGIEFSLNTEDRRFHFMALLPELERGGAIREFFRDNRRLLRELVEGLEENQEHRVESLRALLSDFNETGLEALNRGFPKGRRYRLPRLRMRDLERFVPASRVSRAHLGDYLFSLLEPVALNRVLLLKARLARSESDLAGGLVAALEVRRLAERYRLARAEYADLSPEGLRRRFFAGPGAGDYSSVFDDLGRMSRALRGAGCRIRVLHPIEHGREKALALLASSRDLIDEVEIFNTQDSLTRDPADIRALCEAVNDSNLEAAARGGRPLLAVPGSDATGRSPDIPGMGFIYADRVLAARRGGRGLREATLTLPGRWGSHRLCLPPEAALLVRARGAPVDLAQARETPLLYAMGKISAPRPNRIGDEPDDGSGSLTIRKTLHYLNPWLRDLLLAAFGFLVARSFIGDGYAFLWLGITGLRNMAADLIASRGTRLRSWTLSSVNFDNVARSLFWTGFSVPILGFVKANFDLLWPFATDGVSHNAAKFFFISGANGLYIALHNTLRGFDRGVVRANFFRSILSWPFATAFAPLLNTLGIPSIVQAKLWSDLVAGFIEGGSKYLRILRLRRRDLGEILPRLSARDREDRFAALLELLFLWREEPRTRTSLASILSASPPKAAKAAGKPLPETEATTGPGGLESLIEAISGERLERRLVDYIIEEYPRPFAVRLASLAAETLPDLRAWARSRFASRQRSASPGPQP